MKKLLKLAFERYNVKNNIDYKNYSLSMGDFILKIYAHCDPATYGKQYNKRLLDELNQKCEMFFKRVKDKLDMGDISVEDAINEIILFLEVKISFLSRDAKNYTIRNVRTYQNLDLYLLTFIDCDNNFKEEICLIKPEDLYNNCGLSFSFMNGTKKSNLNNEKVGMATSFKKDSDIHKNIMKHNILNGSDFNDLFQYFGKTKKKKSPTIVFKFNFNGKSYSDKTTNKNYMNFIKDVYNEKGSDFLKNVLHPFYISSSQLMGKQIYKIDDNLFVNTKCSTKVKKRNIHIIANALNGELNYAFPY